MTRDFLPGDFPERVLREVERRRTRARRVRTLGTGLALALVLGVGGRLPYRLSRALSHQHRTGAALALAAADDRDTGDDVLGDDAELDPGSFLAGGLAETRPVLDPSDDSDESLLGRE
jgi:hypothetical protein